MYTPGPPVRDKYWLPLGLNWNGKLRERAFANARSGAPDIPWPQVGIRPHSLLSNHGQATIIARLGCTRACAAAVGAKAVSTSRLVKSCIFTAAQIRCSKYIYLPRIMPGPESMCRKRNLEPVLDAVGTADHCFWVPNGSSVSASKAWSEFNLAAEGILGPGRRCNKTSPFLCARTCIRVHKFIRACKFIFRE